MAYPPKRNQDYEKVEIGSFIQGVIHDIEYDNEHKFSFKGKDTIAPAIRFKFKLDGYSYLHHSRWMRFNVGEKSNLFKHYVSKLVKNARPDMCFDLDELKGMSVRTIWSESNGFQNIDSIFPNGEKKSVKETDEKTVNESLEESSEPVDWEA